MIRDRLRSASAVLVAVGMVACGDAASPRIPTVAQVDLVLADTSLRIGDSIVATARGRDSAGVLVTSASPRWSTSDASVATVSDKGVVRGQAAGIATIRVDAGVASATRNVCVRGDAPQLRVISGDGQRAIVGTSLGQPPVIGVADANGNAIPCVVVRMSLKAPGATVSPDTATTDAGGIVRVQRWTLGTTAGTESLLVSAEGALLAVNAEALPGAPAKLTLVSGDNQIATFGNAMPAPLVVRVLDQFSNPVPNIAVAFRPDTLPSVLSSPDVATDSAGRATTGVRVSAMGRASVTATVTGLVPVRFALRSTGLRAKALSAGGNRACAQGFDDVWYCWGNSMLTPTALPGSTGVTGLSVGFMAECGIAPDATVRCWGSNQFGELGIGVLAPPYPEEIGPVQPIGLSGVSSVYAGNGYACALTRLAETWCWGYNQDAELGNGTQSIQLTLQPARQPWNLRFTTLATASSTPCALDEQGVAYCWGFNANGNVGDGTFATPKLQPTRVATSVRFRSITTGSCALTADAQAYCWGYNGNGELGDGTTITRATPAPMATTIRWQQLSSNSFNCGIAMDQRVLCWGINSSHSLGTTSASFASLPTPVAPGFTATYLSVGFYFACTISEISEVLCWGDNRTGTLGDGTRITRGQPAPVSPPGYP